MSTIGKILIATAFSATVAGAFTGVAVSSETKQPISAVNCSDAHWPMIPAECMEGGQARDVRVITVSLAADQVMQQRFEIAFQ